MPSMLIDKRFANRNMIPMVTYPVCQNRPNDGCETRESVSRCKQEALEKCTSTCTTTSTVSTVHYLLYEYVLPYVLYVRYTY